MFGEDGIGPTVLSPSPQALAIPFLPSHRAVSQAASFGVTSERSVAFDNPPEQDQQIPLQPQPVTENGPPPSSEDTISRKHSQELKEIQEYINTIGSETTSPETWQLLEDQLRHSSWDAAAMDAAMPRRSQRVEPLFSSKRVAPRAEQQRPDDTTTASQPQSSHASNTRERTQHQEVASSPGLQARGDDTEGSGSNSNQGPSGAAVESSQHQRKAAMASQKFPTRTSSLAYRHNRAQMDVSTGGLYFAEQPDERSTRSKEKLKTFSDNPTASPSTPSMNTASGMRRSNTTQRDARHEPIQVAGNMRRAQTTRRIDHPQGQRVSPYIHSNVQIPYSSDNGFDSVNPSVPAQSRAYPSTSQFHRGRHDVHNIASFNTGQTSHVRPLVHVDSFELPANETPIMSGTRVQGLHSSRSAMDGIDHNAQTRHELSDRPNHSTLQTELTVSDDSFWNELKQPKPVSKTLFGEKGWLYRGDKEDVAANKKAKNGGIKGLASKLKEKFGETKGELMKLVESGNRQRSKTRKISTIPISIDVEDQRRVYSEIELMLSTLANAFLIEEKVAGRISPALVQKIQSEWFNKNRPPVLEFRYDLETQLALVRLNFQTMKLRGPSSEDSMQRAVFVNCWKGIARELSIRTYCAPDSALKKLMHDSHRLFELLGAQLPTFLKLTRLQVEILRKMSQAQAARDAHGNVQYGVTRPVPIPDDDDEYDEEEGPNDGEILDERLFRD